MRAIRLHGPRDARFEEVSEPQVASDDVLIRVRAAALCATDIELYDGTMFYLTSGLATYPFIPGHEWSGEVVALGSGVTGFEIGDRVVGECSIGCRTCRQCLTGNYHLCRDRKETGLLRQPGGMAEYISYPRFFLHKVNELAFDDAAFIEPTGIAISAVHKVRVTPADRVAVMGAGPIGLFIVQVARAYGARQVIVIDPLADRRARALELGADIALDPHAGNLAREVAGATGGEMVDAVIEAVGRKEVWPAIVAIVAPRARVVMTGLFAGARCEVDFDPLVVNDVTLYGSLGSPNHWAEAIAMHRRGLVRSSPLVTHRLPLARFAEGVDIARTRRDGAIKVLLAP